MNPNEKDERTRQFDIILYRTEACYPSAFEPAAIPVWHVALADHPILDISAAFTIHIKQSPYLPTIAEIIEILRKHQPPKLQIDHYAGLKRHEVPGAKIKELVDKIGRRIEATKTETDRETRLIELAKQERELKEDENGN
jgi:hypothetical protein